MKTKPLVVAALVLTAVGVSAASGLLIGRITDRSAAVYERLAGIHHSRALAGDVAKAAVRVLVCRLQS